MDGERKRMDPADGYMAIEVGKRTGRSLDEVLESYEKNKGKGKSDKSKGKGKK